MKCLDTQCKETASETSQLIDGQPVRECTAGHRTAKAAPAVVKRTNSIRRVNKKLKLGSLEIAIDTKEHTNSRADVGTPAFELAENE